MKRIWAIQAAVVLLISASACSSVHPSATGTPTPWPQPQPATVTMKFTAAQGQGGTPDGPTATVDENATGGKGSPMVTSDPTVQYNPSPTALKTPLKPVATVPDRPCDLAVPGSPLDVSVPDDTEYQANQPFTKTWRLVNGGTCPWDENYAAVYFSGDLLSAARVVLLNTIVEPGQSVDISVDMVAPDHGGSFQGNWKIKSTSGELFGIGPGGKYPFWVRIKVLPVDIPTEIPAFPTQTVTPHAYSSGLASLTPGDTLDLDQIKINAGVQADLWYLAEKGQTRRLSPIQEASLARFGNKSPSLAECQALKLDSSAIVVDTLPQGTFFCYKTNQGLPGWLRLVVYNTETQVLTVEINTWSIP